MEGFIPLYRKIKEWGWYKDGPTKDLFLHILLSINYKPGIWKGIEIKPGEMVTGRKSLSSELGLSENQIRLALDKLVSTGEITRKTTSKYTILRVVNWETYNQQTTNKPPTNHQQTTTNNKNNNTKIQKYKKGTTETLDATHPNEYQENIKFLKEIRDKVFDPDLSIPDFAIKFPDEWRKFLLYWTEIGKTGKIRAESEKTFEVKRRFATWMSRKKDQYEKEAPRPRGVSC